MRKLLLLLCTILLTLFIASCVKDSDELVFDNPLDESGTNWHDPIIDEIYFSDTSIPINDTIFFTVKADPEKQHDPMDSAFVYDLQTFQTIGNPFDNGYAVIPIVKDDSGDYDIEYWISDQVGRRTEKVETQFRVDLYPPEINTNNNWSVPSGQELRINMELFSSDENGSIIKYYFKSDQLQEYTEQDDPEIMPSWTISDASQTEYMRTLFLKVMDDDSLVVETETSVKVTRYKPVINTFNLPEVATKGINIHIAVEADDDDNAINTYKWAIGKDAPNADFNKETSDPGFDTTFDQEGTYHVRVICVDAGGVESEMQEKTITVNSENTTVTITKVQEVSSPVPAGTTLTFEVTTNPTNIVKSYNWMVVKNGQEEENISSESASYTYTFNQPGEYRVEVLANGIQSNTVIFNFTVEGDEIKPTIKINNSDQPVEKFRDEKLNLSVTIDDNGVGVKHIEWFINDKSLLKDAFTTKTFDLSGLNEELNTFYIIAKLTDNEGRVSEPDSLKVIINKGRPEVLMAYRHSGELSDIKTAIDENSQISVILQSKLTLSSSARDININTGSVETIEWAVKRDFESTFPDGMRLPYGEKFVFTPKISGLFVVSIRAIDNEGNFSDRFLFTAQIR